MAKKQKLKFRFINPNTPEATADYIAKLFVEVNQKKIDRILKEEAEKQTEIEKSETGRYIA